MKFPLLLIFLYTIGSIPSAVIITRLFKGIDILKYGSCNPGATNVLRVAGVVPATITLLLDILKGFLGISIAKTIFKEPLLLMGCMVCLVLGHCYSIFLKFRGGKGVAVSAGIIFGIEPKIFILSCFIFLLVFFIIKYVSLASILTSIFTWIVFMFSNLSPYIKIGVTLMVGLILYSHRTNIKRLIKYEELRLKIR